MKTNKSNPEVRQIIQDIRAAYVPTMAYDRLDEYFDQLLEQRRADLSEGLGLQTDPLEPAYQRPILLEVIAVFLVGGRPDVISFNAFGN